MSKLLENYYAMKKYHYPYPTKVLGSAADRYHSPGPGAGRNISFSKKQMADTQKKDKYKVYGELINTYGYELEPEAKSLTCLNYYTDKEITIPLDPQLSARDNAVRYFDRYNKLKTHK